MRSLAVAWICLVSLTVSGVAQDTPSPLPPDGAIAQLHVDEVHAVTYLTDARILAVAAGPVVELRDASSLALLNTLRGHTAAVTCVAVSPDGQMLASGSADETIRLWNVATGELTATVRGHEDSVLALAFSPDGELLASGSWDGTLRLWETSSGELLRTIDSDGWYVSSLAFSSDGQKLAVGSSTDAVQLRDVPGSELIGVIAGHRGSVFSVAFSPDTSSDLLATASADGEVRVWNASSGELLLTLSGHTGEVNSVAFSSDGGLLASCSYDSTIDLWDSSSGLLLCTLRGHEEEVLAVALSPDGTALASGSADGTLLVWDLESVFGELPAHLPRTRVLLARVNGPENLSEAEAQELLQTVGDTLRARLEAYGLTDAQVVLAGDGLLRIRIPGGPEPRWHEELRALLGQVALVEIYRVVRTGMSPLDPLELESESQKVLRGRNGLPYIVEMEAILANHSIAGADPSCSSTDWSTSYLLELTLLETGAQRMADAVLELGAGGSIALAIDGVVYGSPWIHVSLVALVERDGWHAVRNLRIPVTVSSTAELTQLAATVNGGLLPAEVSILEDQIE